MPVYVDASALTPLIIVEDYTPWALATILDSGESPLVSDFAAAEVSSAISRLVRMRSVAREEGVRLLGGFDDWVRKDALAVINASTDIVEADRLVRRFELQLQTPDALHLVLARRCEAALVTLDRRMASAAATLGIPFVILPN